MAQPLTALDLLKQDPSILLEIAKFLRSDLRPDSDVKLVKLDPDPDSNCININGTHLLLLYGALQEICKAIEAASLARAQAPLTTIVEEGLERGNTAYESLKEAGVIRSATEFLEG